jgi:dolichol-phosphate mannosyltransferase
MLEHRVILPTYNARDNIGEILGHLVSAFPDFRVLVVDDTSPDGPAEAVSSLQQNYPRLDLQLRRERGFGSAYVAGVFSRLLRTGRF